MHSRAPARPGSSQFAPPVEIRRAFNTAARRRRHPMRAMMSMMPFGFVRRGGDEQEFLNALQPMQQLRPRLPGQRDSNRSQFQIGRRSPYIDPNAAGCVMCDDLSCMAQCPSSTVVVLGRRSTSAKPFGTNRSACETSPASPARCVPTTARSVRRALWK